MFGKKFFTSPPVKEYVEELEQERLINDEFQTFVCNYKTTYEGKTSTPRKDIGEWLSGFIDVRERIKGEGWEREELRGRESGK